LKERKIYKKLRDIEINNLDSFDFLIKERKPDWRSKNKDIERKFDELSENYRNLLWEIERGFKNPLTRFLELRCIKERYGKIQVDDFVVKYDLYREKFDLLPTQKANLTRSLKKHGILKKQIMVNKNRKYYYCGIVWKIKENSIT